MTNLPFLVSEFDENLVSLLIKECFGASFPDIRNKRQTKYLLDYLIRLDARTVVCETEYVDKYYLEDFSRYYVKCFSNYPSRCARLHFFDKKFTHDDFLIELNSNSSSLKLNEHYLGFIIIKPLPMTFIGRTCLKGIDTKHGKSITRDYSPNLFGIELKVKSVAFQEQDKVVSACASTALWSLFHAMSYYPREKIPSPSEITLNALSDTPYNINGFPNKGLTQNELLRSMESQKVKRHELSINTEQNDALALFDKNVTIYIDSGLPVLMGTEIFEKCKDGSFSLKGEHAVTLLGYKLKDGAIDEICFHDDRVGPYCWAKLLKKGQPFLIEKNTFFFEYINKDLEEEFLAVNSLTIGTYHKVRIPAQIISITAQSLEQEINSQINDLFDDPKETLALKIQTKIELKLSSRLKAEYLNFQIKDKSQLLTSHWPKYIWKVSISNQQGKLFDILYDATDIPQGSAVIDIAIFQDEHYESLSDLLLSDFDAYNNSHLDQNRLISESFFIQTIRFIKKYKTKSNIENYLNNCFGDLRPPNYIKDTEYSNGEISFQSNSNEFFGSCHHESLSELVKDGAYKIWVITKHGSLVLGDDLGHPTLTDAKPARIAGEIFRTGNQFLINSASGRYSRHYGEDSAYLYLENALNKFKEVFVEEHTKITLGSRIKF